MPERPDAVPLHAARVADLKRGRHIRVSCRTCGNEGAVSVTIVRSKFPADEFVKWIGGRKRFICSRCNGRYAAIDARPALGHV
jgi:ribosomal protein S27E